MGNKEIMRETENMKIGSPQNESSEMAIEVDDELKLNVDEQQDDKNIWSNNEPYMKFRKSQQLEPPWKIISLFLWHVTKHWHTQIDYKKIIEEEHPKLLKRYCGKMWRNKKEVDNHIYETCKPISCECTSKDEVENYNEHIVVEK